MGNYTGPYKLTWQEIARVVTQNGPGNYLLGSAVSETSLHVKYVGRSDTNIRARLEQHANGRGYTHFVFRYATSVKDAYEQECLAFHKFKHDLDNAIHPDAPDGKNYPCPYPRCDHRQK